MSVMLESRLPVTIQIFYLILKKAFSYSIVFVFMCGESYIESVLCTCWQEIIGIPIAWAVAEDNNNNAKS